MKTSTIVKIGIGVAAIAGVGYLAYRGWKQVRKELKWATEEFEENAYKSCEDECDCCECDDEDCICDCGCECHEDREPAVANEEEFAETATEAVADVKEGVVEEKPAKAKKEKAAKAE